MEKCWSGNFGGWLAVGILFFYFFSFFFSFCGFDNSFKLNLTLAFSFENNDQTKIIIQKSNYLLMDFFRIILFCDLCSLFVLRWRCKKCKNKKTIVIKCRDKMHTALNLGFNEDNLNNTFFNSSSMCKDFCVKQWLIKSCN